MASSRGMDRELRRTLALSRALLRELGPANFPAAVPAAGATAAFATVIEAGLPFISHPIIPSAISHRLHAAAQQAFQDSCRIAIEHRGLQSLEKLQTQAGQIRSSWIKMYTQRVEDMVSACSQKLKTQKQIADAILDYAWQQETHPNFREIVKLSRLTKRTVKQVTRWFENRRARYKNKPARGPSDMHEVLKNIAAMKKPALPIDIFEDESKPQRHRDHGLPLFLRPRTSPRRPLVSHLAPQIWPRPYDLSTPARTDALGPTVIPPSKTDPAQALLEVTKHAMDDLIMEMSRLTLRQRVEPRPTKKTKKDPKLAQITIGPAPTTPITTNEPSSKPPRLYSRRRRALAKSKEAAAVRQATASSSASKRTISSVLGLPLGVPPVSSVPTASSSADTDSVASSSGTSSIDFNMLIARLAADAHAAQLAPSSLNLLPTLDDLSTFFDDFGSTADFYTSHEVTIESLSGSDPLFDQLSGAAPEVVGSAVASPLDGTSYDLAQQPLDLSALFDFNVGLDAIELPVEPPVQMTTTTPSLTDASLVLSAADVLADPSFSAITDPREAAALLEVLQLLDDPMVLEQLEGLTNEEQIEVLTEFGMDLYKDKFRGKGKGKEKPAPQLKSGTTPSSDSKGKLTVESKSKDRSTTESTCKGKAPAESKIKTKKARKARKSVAPAPAPATPSQETIVSHPLPSDPSDPNTQMVFDPSLLQAAASMDFSLPTWPVPPAAPAASPTFPTDPMFDPVQLVDMSLDPTQYDPALFAAMQFDPALLATASLDSTPLANYVPTDTIQTTTSIPSNVPMPEFDFSQYTPAMQAVEPFALGPQPMSFSAPAIDSQPIFVPDVAFNTAPLTYQQDPLAYQQVDLPYQQVSPLSYEQAPPLSYEQVPPLSYQQVSPLSYQQAPLSYQQAPLSYQQALPVPYQQTPFLYEQAPLSYQPAPLSYQPDPLSAYQHLTPFSYEQQPYFNFDQQASLNFDYMASSTPVQPTPTFIPDLYNPFLTPDWFCAPMETMLQMPLTA